MYIVSYFVPLLFARLALRKCSAVGRHFPQTRSRFQVSERDMIVMYVQEDHVRIAFLIPLSSFLHARAADRLLVALFCARDPINQLVTGRSKSTSRDPG